MKTIRHTFLRLRLFTSKKARTRYVELQERLRLRDISMKAQLHHEREVEFLEAVKQKAATHEERKMRVLVKSGDAKRLGDKVLLSKKLIPVSSPVACRHSTSAISDSIRVEEATVSEDQFRNMLDERHTNIKKAAARNYQRRRRAEQSKHENTTIAPTDALHFMMTGKIPVRTRAELTEIVDMGGVPVEEVEVTADDAALLYLTNRNHRK